MNYTQALQSTQAFKTRFHKRNPAWREASFAVREGRDEKIQTLGMGEV